MLVDGGEATRGGATKHEIHCLEECVVALPIEGI
jgi:hypothetical protein